MEEKISLKDAERRVFRTTLEDGLLDIFIGCFVLVWAVAPPLSVHLGDFWSSVVFLPFWGLVYAAILIVRNRVVTPRIGSVMFGPTRKKKLTRLTTVLAIVNLIAFAAGLLLFFNSELMSGRMITLAIGFLVMLMGSLVGIVLSCGRFFFYGLLFFLSFVIGEWLYQGYGVAHHGFPVTFGVSSAIIIITGVVMFARFLGRYPLPDSESQQEG